MSGVDQIMRLADEWYAHGQTSHSGIDEKYAALRAAVEQIVRERDAERDGRDAMDSAARCNHKAYEQERERAERAEAENLQRGNVIGRITTHLLGNKNNVSDEDVVIAAAEVGRELQGTRLALERAERERDAALALLKEARATISLTTNDPAEIIGRIDSLLEKKAPHE